MDARILAAVVGIVGIAACSSGDETGTGGSGGTAGTGGAAGSAGAGGASSNDCVRSGGICECSCGPGTAPDSARANACPQPCPTCGRCSDQCCMPTTIVCGTQTCTVNQICVHPCSGTPPQPPPHCADIPAPCGASVTCGCLTNICGGAGTCTMSGSEGRDVTCQGCA
jgi:hypothetical protein